MKGSSSKDDLKRRREFLVTLGNALREHDKEEQRKKRIFESELKPHDMLGDYLVFGHTKGYVDRVKSSNDRKPVFAVWDALNVDTSESCVLKGPTAKALIEHPELELLVQNESIILSKLQHPNIVKSYGTVKKRLINYVSLEHLPYQIHEVVGMEPNLEGIAFFALESTKALQYLKKKGVVHGDIKVSQFMGTIDEELQKYQIKLIDFAGSMHPELVRQSKVFYTTEYAAPEVLEALESKDTLKKRAAFSHKADIYSLGLAFASVALSGKMDPDKISELFEEPAKSAERSLEAAYANYVPYAFNRIIEAMTVKDIDRRLDADQLMARLEDFCYTQSVGPKIVEHIDLFTKKVTREIRSPY